MREEINIANARAEAQPNCSRRPNSGKPFLKKGPNTKSSELPSKLTLKRNVCDVAEWSWTQRCRPRQKQTFSKGSRKSKAIRHEAEAHHIRIVGEAEAEAYCKREMVEVDMLRLKAEAYKEYGQATLAITMIETMPSVAKKSLHPCPRLRRLYSWAMPTALEGLQP